MQQDIVTRKTKRGSEINEYHADNYFKNIEAYVVLSTLHTQVAGNHEPTLERNIRTLKDGIESKVHLVLYRKMPLLMIEFLIGQVQSMMNYFHSKTGILTTTSVRNIIEGSPNLDYNTMSLKLGAYIKLFEGTNNAQHITSVGRVVLNPSNKKGGYYFTSLRTGCKIHVFIWMKLAITREVITRVKELGKEDRHPLMENGPVFERSLGNIILDKKEDKEVFDNLMNDLHHHHNDDNDRKYVSENSDEDDNIIGSWEA